MELDYTLLKQAIIDKKGDSLIIKELAGEWVIELWNKNKPGMTREHSRLVGTYYISQEVKIRTILDFLPNKTQLTFHSDILAVKFILKEMGLCQ